MKFIKLFESYSTQKKLEELTKDILERIAEETYEKLPSDFHKIKKFKPTKLGDFNHVHFKELGTFMQDYDILSINILSNKDLVGYQFTTENGVYRSSEIEKDILLKLDNYTLKKCNDMEIVNGMWKGDRLGRMKDVIYNDYKKTLIHELQHAYDEWRSGGKAIDTPDGFDSSRVKNDELISKGIDSLEKDELQFVSDHYTDYLNIRYEVDARFTASIQKTTFYDLDFDLSLDNNKDVYVMLPFDDVKRSFKINMHEFKSLSEKEKWRTLRKFGQFYELEKDFIKEINTKQKEFK